MGGSVWDPIEHITTATGDDTGAVDGDGVGAGLGMGGAGGGAGLGMEVVTWTFGLAAELAALG